jgi:hypothetical protein
MLFKLENENLAPTFEKNIRNREQSSSEQSNQKSS